MENTVIIGPEEAAKIIIKWCTEWLTTDGNGKIRITLPTEEEFDKLVQFLPIAAYNETIEINCMNQILIQGDKKSAEKIISMFHLLMQESRRLKINNLSGEAFMTAAIKVLKAGQGFVELAFF